MNLKASSNWKLKKQTCTLDLLLLTELSTLMQRKFVLIPRILFMFQCIRTVQIRANLFRSKMQTRISKQHPNIPETYYNIYFHSR